MKKLIGFERNGFADRRVRGYGAGGESQSRQMRAARRALAPRPHTVCF